MNPQTYESIAKARRAQLEERAAVERQAGIRIRDDGHVQLTPSWVIHCPRCGYAARGRREGQTLNSVVAHLVKVHLQEAKL